MDIALLRRKRNDFTKEQSTIPFAFSQAELDDEVLVIGNALAIGDSISRGVVRSGILIPSPNDASYVNQCACILTDVSLAPGVSGAPFMNRRGEVIGLSQWVRQEGFSGGVNLFFLKNVVEKLCSLNRTTIGNNYTGERGKGYLNLQNYNFLNGV